MSLLDSACAQEKMTIINSLKGKTIEEKNNIKSYFKLRGYTGIKYSKASFQ